MGREIQSDFGDGLRISGPIVGDKEFAAKILSDISALDEKERLKVCVEKGALTESPLLPDLIDAACVALNLQPWKFEQQPQRRQPALARRMVAYLWVKTYKKPQIEIARHLGVTTGAVSCWYAKAVSEINDIEPFCDAIVFALTKGIRKQLQEKTDNTVRYNLQFEQEP